MYQQVGIGLAATQVGIALRIIVMDDGKRGTSALINPAIAERRGAVSRGRGLPVPARPLRRRGAEQVGARRGARRRRPADVARGSGARWPASSSTRSITWTACSSSTGFPSDARPDQEPHPEGRPARQGSAPRLRALTGGAVKVLFYGTPEFAVPTLEALLERHEVMAAVTQPDRPAGRGQRVSASAVKRRAEAAGIPVLQPARLRDPRVARAPGRLGAEIAVVVAFGQILPKAVLDAPARGSINVHASLLPRYRGAAPSRGPSSAARRRPGSRRFRWTRAWTPARCCCARPRPIGPDETAGELAARLRRLGRRRAAAHARAARRARRHPAGRQPGHARAAPQEGGRLAAPGRAGARASSTGSAAATRGRAPP